MRPMEMVTMMLLTMIGFEVVKMKRRSEVRKGADLLMDRGGLN